MASSRKSPQSGVVKRVLSSRAISPLLTRLHRRAYKKGGVRVESADLRIEAINLSEMKVNARLTMASQVPRSSRVVLYTGSSLVYGVSSPDGKVGWFQNGKFMSVRFPAALPYKKAIDVCVRYKYYPDSMGGMVFPATESPAFPVTSTIFHPVSFRVISQGRLVSETRKVDGMTTVWEHPRSHRLNLIFCRTLDTFHRRQDEIDFYLHIQREHRTLAEAVFPICIRTYLEQVAQHGPLPYTTYQFVEADQSDGMDFNGRGLVVVGNGCFASMNEARIYGAMTHEISKEWIDRRR